MAEQRAPGYLEIFLISLATILLEVSYTRVFSFKLVYYFTYLIIGISLLGLGAGGVFVAVSRRLRHTPPARLVSTCSFVAAAAVLLGYLVVAGTHLNAFELVASAAAHHFSVALPDLARLTLICAALFTPFFAAGLAVATVFSTQTQRINRLYFADLLGAGLGCAVSVPLMRAISPPGCIQLAGLFFSLAAVRPAAARFRSLLIPIAPLAAALLLVTLVPSLLPDPVPDRIKTMSDEHIRRKVVFSRWSPVFRVDVVPLSEALPAISGLPAGSPPEGLLLGHDGAWGSILMRFDGDVSSLGRYDTNERSYPFKVLAPAPRVVIIGAAGGNEILASLYYHAAHVTAVELNPVTISLLTTQFRDYSGRLAEDGRVTLVNAEGRAFLRSHPEHYDLIWFVAPDSYAAMNAASAGAFVLSESYLYTAEMIVEALDHLTPDGVVCAQFGEFEFERKPNRTVRYLSTAREGFRRLDIEDFGRHVLVATSSGWVFSASTILLKRSPFTEDDVRRFVENTAVLPDAMVRHAWTRPDGDDPVGKVISLPEPALKALYREYPFDVRPVTDDAPFFWHFVPFLRSGMRIGNPEGGLGERLLQLLLAVATVFALAFLLAPLVMIRDQWRLIPYKAKAAVYFAALGVGFMFLEVTLIQKLTLFLGYPTYSLTVTLFALLLSTGVGSLVSETYTAPRHRLLGLLAGSLGLLVLFYAYGLAPLLHRGFGWPFGVRVAVAIVLLAPLGLCLGAFMPLGLRAVAAVTPHREAFVAWAWAVNGFFSVVASILSTILSMTVGFNAVMLTALAVYLIGILALLGIPSAGADRSSGDVSNAAA